MKGFKFLLGLITKTATVIRLYVTSSCAINPSHGLCRYDWFIVLIEKPPGHCISY